MIIVCANNRLFRAFIQVSDQLQQYLYFATYEPLLLDRIQLLLTVSLHPISIDQGLIRVDEECTVAGPQQQVTDFLHLRLLS